MESKLNRLIREYQEFIAPFWSDEQERYVIPEDRQWIEESLSRDIVAEMRLMRKD